MLKFLTLYSQEVLSINALFTEQDATLIPNVESIWLNGDHDENVMTIKKVGDNFYWLWMGNSNNSSLYEAAFISINNTIFLDLVPKLPDSLGSKDYRDQIQPAHSFYKIKIESDTLWAAELNYAWFYDALLKNRNALNHTWVRNGLLITADTHDLRMFIEEHSNDPVFINRPISFVRKSIARSDNWKNSISDFMYDVPVNVQQKCLSAFPLKDGWLGGDGDISIPVNDTQSLFIFGDTYVGQKSDTRQSHGYTMVSSTVAVTTCTPDGNYHIQYYWRNMYSDHPGPVFESFTNRYNYWATDAFMYKDCLYVFMQKVGAKIAVAPDDFFPFSQLGFSLAKVANPINNTPDQWKSDLISLSFLVSYFTDIHATVKDENYLYFFAERAHNKTNLLRLKLNFIDLPKDHIEYYSQNHTWKPGIDSLDMAIVLPESPGYSIHYHNDIKKWIMISGPGFMDNKIKVRTASALTGPWSESVTVYECPEITPGTQEYSKNNHCYLGRELIQNYDKTTRSMYLTYDINNKDFEEIKSNTKIYTPKIIRVSLSKFGIR